MSFSLTANELHKLALDDVFEIQPDEAKIWRDERYGPLIVTTGLKGHPDGDPGRYTFLCTVEEARAAYEEIADQWRRPALCAKANFCPNAILVGQDERSAVG